MSTTDFEYFEIDGIRYHAHPNMKQFLADARIAPSSIRLIVKSLDKGGLFDPETLFTMTLDDLINMDKITHASAIKIFEHALRVRNQGKMIQNWAELQMVDAKYQYLHTGSSSLDLMMQYQLGNIGWRSNTLVELTGGPGTGKTQLAMQAAVECMKTQQDGGWDRGVIWIDTKNSFNYQRMYHLAEVNALAPNKLNDSLFVVNADNSDQLKHSCSTIIQTILDTDIGLIVVDSLTHLLKHQFPTYGMHLKNLRPREYYINDLLHKLKALAKYHNLLVLVVSELHLWRGDMGGLFRPMDPDLQPEDKLTIGYQKDIRLWFGPATRDEREQFGHYRMESHNAPVQFVRVRLDGCAYLATRKGFFLLDNDGIHDPDYRRD